MTYVIYEIYVTPFLNINCINVFMAFVCNLDGLYKKLETLLNLFFQEIVCDYIHSNTIEANQFHNNKLGVDGSKTVLFGKLILVILPSSMTFTSNLLRLDPIFTYLPACLYICKTYTAHLFSSHVFNNTLSFKVLIHNLEIDLSCIWNCNKFGFPTDPSKASVLAKK